MAERASPRTLLEKIVHGSDHTVEEWCAQFDAMARKMKESSSLSPRQLHRWMAGQVDNARPAAKRVAARLWEMPFAQLLAPPGSPARVTRQVAGGVDTVVAESPDAHLLEAVTTMAAHESSRHAAEVGGGVSQSSVEQVQAEVWRLARRFADTPPVMLLAEARRARDLAYAALDRTRRPAQTRELYLAAGQLCGLMAVASFDLAVWEAAAEQARAAHVYAELVDHRGLRAWSRGTQALIAYWTGRPRNALVHIEAGLADAPNGAPRTRLRCIEARAWSHIGGDPRRTTEALRSGDAALESDAGVDDLHDELGGEFGWGPSRHAACAGTALLALGDAKGAADRVRAALRMMPDDPFSGLVAERAHIDLACAELSLGRLESAESALQPVWQMPVGLRRHGITDRLSQISRKLSDRTWQGNLQAAELRDRIEVFNADAQGRALPAAG